MIQVTIKQLTKSDTYKKVGAVTLTAIDSDFNATCKNFADKINN